MHKGVFGGKNLTQNQSILALGESHHHGKADDPEYTTERVVMYYFRHPNDKCYKFFDKIAGGFGFGPKDRELFWNQVWFENYVAESNCGIGNSKARKLIGEHRAQYNKEFRFIFQPPGRKNFRLACSGCLENNRESHGDYHWL